MTGLTTNDVRVLRHLLTHGHHTTQELTQALRYGGGARPALLRIPSLQARGLVTDVKGNGHDGTPVLDVTADGARALLACDRAAYGRFA